MVIADSPLGPLEGFNWVYLIELFVCGVLGLFFLFYFNRLFATVVSYIIRSWTWHKYRAYVEITALQISLLGGRVFFKGIRYQAQNITVLIHDGQITWRYWLRQVQDAEIFQNPSGRPDVPGSDGGMDRSRRSSSISKAEHAGGQTKDLPCRISVKVSAVEAFVYNRTPAFEMMVDATLKKAKEQSANMDGFTFSENSSAKEHKRTDSSKPPAMSELPAWLQLLPVKIECKRAAAAIGNENTTSIVVAKLERAFGVIDAGQSGPLDLYKLLLDFDVDTCSAQLKPNADYKQNQKEAAIKVIREKKGKAGKLPGSRPMLWFRIQRTWRKLMSCFADGSTAGSIKTWSMKSATDEPSRDQEWLQEGEWHGLSRYLDDSGPSDGSNWNNIEYARSSLIMDCKELGFRFFFDVPGYVPLEQPGSALTEDINGSEPPEYGMEFYVHGATVVYGPWADRERVRLQQAFFPSSYVDATPAHRLKPGDTRVWTVFKIHVCVEEDAIFRVPTRESSKDVQWQNIPTPRPPEDASKQNKKRNKSRKRKQNAPAADVRPFGWLDVKVKQDSTVNYVMDMFPRANGYKNFLNVDAKGTEMTSSVNHNLLWRAGPLALDADLSYPLGWREPRRWPFNIVCNDLELFILRDHFFLIIDIVNDWASGPPPEFYTFVPYVYTLNLEFRNWCFYLNVNDANIINDPADLTKNDFLTLEGKSITAKLDIPMEDFRPKRNEITWDVAGHALRMRMLTPSRNTLFTFLKDDLVATLPELTLTGGMDQNGELHPATVLTDLLRFDIWAKGLELKAYGQLVRQFINVKENYFGDYIHFKTLEEFQTASEDMKEANVKTTTPAPPPTPNELDVVLCIIVEDTTLLLPSNLYSCENYVKAQLAQYNLDLRVNSYYLDLGLNLSPLAISHGSLTGTVGDSPPQAFISHVNLYGHRAFGAPPLEPVYFDQFDVDVGSLTGECSGDFTHALVRSAQSFAFAFEDLENALSLQSPNIFHSCVFVRVRTGIIRLWLRAGTDALLVSLQPVTVHSNDWANEWASQRITVSVPELTVACVDTQADDHSKKLPTSAFVRTGVSVNVVVRKSEFSKERQAQQTYVRDCDRRTCRTPFLLYREDTLPVDDPDGTDNLDPPAMQVPPIPCPLNDMGQPITRPRSMRSYLSGASAKSKTSSRSDRSIASSIRSFGQNARRFSRLPARQKSRRSDRASTAASHRSFYTSSSSFRSERVLDNPFAEPNFPLQSFEPSEKNVPPFPQSNNLPKSAFKGMPGDDSSISDFQENMQDTGVFIRVWPGIRGFIESKAVTCLVNFLDDVLPRTAEDVMDAYQSDVISKLPGKQKAKTQILNEVEIMATVPWAQIRVMNFANAKTDQLDVGLLGVQLMVRMKDQLRANKVDTKVSLYSTVDSIEAAVYQRQGGSSELTQLARARVGDVQLWAVLSQDSVVHASVRESEVVLAGQTTERIVSLAVRTAPLVEELKGQIESPLDKARNKLVYLVYAITQHGEGSSDPPFLSRMTYLLRAFPNHLRNQESWKVLSRLRQMLDSLQPSEKHELTQKLDSKDLHCPRDAPSQVLTSWGQWRNWDVPNFGETLAFRIWQKHIEGLPMDSAEGGQLTLVVTSQLLRVALESGGAPNQLTVEDFTLAVDVIPPKKPTGLLLAKENTRTMTLIQLHTGAVRLDLNWTVIDIVRRILPIVDKLETHPPVQRRERSRSRAKSVVERSQRQDVHFVFATDSGTIKLKTINLRHVIAAQGVKVSFTATSSQAAEQNASCMNTLVNLDQAITELHGPSGQLWETKLVSPSIYVHQTQPIRGPSSVDIAASYDALCIRTADSMPGMLAMVDLVITDEVSEIVKLVQSQPEGGSSSLGRHANLNVALLAGDLEMEVLLLQTLSYRIVGGKTRLRVAPRLVGRKGVDVDFDIDKQTHGFVNLSRGEHQHQGMVELPLISGNVHFQTARIETLLSSTTRIGKIEIDAAAVQAVVGVVHRPEVKEVFKAIKGNIDDIQQHVEDFGSGGTAKGVDQKRFLFDLRLALAGVRVSSGTSQTRKPSAAKAEFGIGPLHATVSNRKTFSDANTVIPEVHVQIDDIGARLWTDEQDKVKPCGSVKFGIKMHFNSHTTPGGTVARELDYRSDGIVVDAFPETASALVDVINHLQDRLRDLDLLKDMERIRQLRNSRNFKKPKVLRSENDEGDGFSAADLLSVKTTASLTNIQAFWHVHEHFGEKPHNAVLTLAGIEFTTGGGHQARLAIWNILLQLVQVSHVPEHRSSISALLPELIFSVGFWSQGKDRSLAFKASGKSLDVRLDSRFMVPVKSLQNSIEFAIDRFKKDTATWQSITGAPRQNLLDTKHLAALLVEADFDGAKVHLQSSTPRSKTQYYSHEGQTSATTLTSPGIGLKVEYNSNSGKPTVNGELQVEASSNMLLPSVVPLVLEISDSVKEVMQTDDSDAEPEPEVKPTQKFFEDDSIVSANPENLFGKTKVDLGLRICRQEFGLSCQPIGRVDAKATLGNFYLTMNTIETQEHGHFFAMSAEASTLSAYVKHVYSREPTFSFDMDSVVFSLMNSKHLSGVSGISAIVKFDPTTLSINAKQLQDLLLFREIWLPPEIRNAAPNPSSQDHSDDFVQRYHMAASAAAFPWNATVSVAVLKVNLDLGQSIGKTSFAITNLWASQQKSSDWEQNLCIGLDEMAMNSFGRMSGFINLKGLAVRTLIRWPEGESNRKPIIQASAGFASLCAKAVFDYQAFAFGDIDGLDFLMFNVRTPDNDRLVAVLDCAKAYVFCTSTSPAQAAGLYQAFDRLIQEKEAAHTQSLKDIERQLHREKRTVSGSVPAVPKPTKKQPPQATSPVPLQTDVVVTIGSVCFGIYPTTFFDPQILKLEARSVQAHFAVGLQRSNTRIHSDLGMTMGQLQVALASTPRPTATQKALEVSVDEIVSNATQARGGTIVRVPEVKAVMQTWQAVDPRPNEDVVDYVFKSVFEGKIDVGWNFARIDFIKTMWNSHSKAMAKMGREVAEPAVRITAGRELGGGGKGVERNGNPHRNTNANSNGAYSNGGKLSGKDSKLGKANPKDTPTQGKITAEVHLPISKYEYRALQPPIIETPQLRDMGEATPPLEWIGLNRERLPNVTHQIVIVPLQEVAREVGGAYGRILG
ncbi:hypothetical protein K470DRAFT_256772 [Piedraia hortae CBS 480.64]|uniref:Fermentation associated protein n=1 Tax=Piedraia hortae CBS 480.64 TaxID=1314780 RepID=A0A6A7C2Q0_9PEZI|nr:hypothetical protein K470DRAFT_256772 [Piedraia hortae CBS 480.64]